MTQSVLVGSVAVVITVLMLLLGFFDHPHGEGLGGLKPAAMERSLRIVDAQLDAARRLGRPALRRQGQRPLNPRLRPAPVRGLRRWAHRRRRSARGRVSRMTRLSTSTQAGKMIWLQRCSPAATSSTSATA